MIKAPQVISIAETRVAGEVPLWTHPGWAEQFPWLVQGTTGRDFNLGLSGDQPVGAALDRWRTLRAALGMSGAVHARQVHGADVAVHPMDGIRGMLVMEGVDGHLSDRPGFLLSVSVADCVPVFLVDEDRRAVAVLHAGWRGTAAGIVARGLERAQETYGTEPPDVWLHTGPAICGDCYEVGPEVHAAVRPGQEPPVAPTPIDLRSAIAEQAIEAGIRPERISISAHCTLCGPGEFFSHRRGSTGRQMGVVGVR